MNPAQDQPTPASPAPVQPVGRPPAARNSWVDVAKGVLILFVVLGHLVGGLGGAGLLGKSPFWGWLYQWIYAFHMPAFVLLAGLFLERSLRVGFPAFAIEKTKSLYYPRVLWGVIYWAMLIFAQKYANSKPDYGIPWRLLYDPLGDFWFLMSLFLFSLVYGGLRTFGLPRITICVVAICGMVAAQFLGPSWPPLVTHLVWYMGWLMLGVLLADRLLAASLATTIPPNWVLLAMFLVGGVVMSIQIPHPYDGPPPFRLEWSIPGTIGVLSLAILIARLATPTPTPSNTTPSPTSTRSPGTLLASVLEFLGRQSLQIYVLSGIGSVGCRVALTKVLHMNNMWLLLAGGMVAGVALPLLVNWACERIGFEYAFRWGPRPTSRNPAAAQRAT